MRLLGVEASLITSVFSLQWCATHREAPADVQGVPVGILFDFGYFRLLTIVGSVLYLLGLFTLSAATTCTSSIRRLTDDRRSGGLARPGRRDGTRTRHGSSEDC